MNLVQYIFHSSLDQFRVIPLTFSVIFYIKHTNLIIFCHSKSTLIQFMSLLAYFHFDIPEDIYFYTCFSLYVFLHLHFLFAFFWPALCRNMLAATLVICFDCHSMGACMCVWVSFYVCVFISGHIPSHTHTHPCWPAHPHNQVACGKMRVHCTEVVQKKVSEQ